MVHWDGRPPTPRSGRVALGFGLLMPACAGAAFAQVSAAGDPARNTAFSLAELFTFLFVTLGPLKVLAPFAGMTRGRDASFRRGLALQATLIAALALLAAATLGAGMLQKWGISLGALQLTAGLVMFLVALRTVLSQFEGHDSPPGASGTRDPGATISQLAFSPLAFPTIVTPYGIAVVVIAVTLAGGDRTLIGGILVLTGLVLGLDLLAMLVAERILRRPLVRSALGIVGAMMGILQVALGVEAAVRGLRVMGVLGTAP